MNSYRHQKNTKSSLDRKMLALIGLTLVSSVIGGWPFIALAAVFIYTQIIVKIPMVSIGVIMVILITLPIITSIIRNSKQLSKLSTRIGYFLLIGLSTFSTAGGVYNGTHNVIAAIIAGFIVIIIVTLIFNDSENNNFNIIPRKYTGPDSPIPDKFIPANVSEKITNGALLTIVFFTVTLIWTALEISEEIATQGSQSNHMNWHDVIASSSAIKLSIGVFIPIIILGFLINYFVAIHESKMESLQARDDLATTLNNTMILKLKLAISEILQPDGLTQSDAHSFKNSRTFDIVYYNIKTKSSLSNSEIANIIDKLIIAYPNIIKGYTIDEFNQILDKFIKP